MIKSRRMEWVNINQTWQSEKKNCIQNCNPIIQNLENLENLASAARKYLK
jgi:hypothetical protein